MGIIAEILGTGKVIEEGFKLIDDMHTSTEEALEARAKAKTDLLNSYAPFKRTQRLLAVAFVTTFLSCFVVVLGLSLAKMADVEIVRSVVSEFYIGETMMLIIGFYFGGGFAEGVIKARKK